MPKRLHCLVFAFFCLFGGVCHGKGKDCAKDRVSKALVQLTRPTGKERKADFQNVQALIDMLRNQRAEVTRLRGLLDEYMPLEGTWHWSHVRSDIINIDTFLRAIPSHRIQQLLIFALVKDLFNQLPATPEVQEIKQGFLFLEKAHAIELGFQAAPAEIRRSRLLFTVQGDDEPWHQFVARQSVCNFAAVANQFLLAHRSALLAFISRREASRHLKELSNPKPTGKALKKSMDQLQDALLLETHFLAAEVLRIMTTFHFKNSSQVEDFSSALSQDMRRLSIVLERLRRAEQGSPVFSFTLRPNSYPFSNFGVDDLVKLDHSKAASDLGSEKNPDVVSDVHEVGRQLDILQTLLERMISGLASLGKRLPQ